jgi:hypothetical protein
MHFTSHLKSSAQDGPDPERQQLDFEVHDSPGSRWFYIEADHDREPRRAGLLKSMSDWPEEA